MSQIPSAPDQGSSSGEVPVIDGIPQYLLPQTFEELNLPEFPPYEGKGSTSYFERDDPDKVGYLQSIGFKIPDRVVDPETGAVLDRAAFVTMFIVTGTVISMDRVRRAGGDMERILPGFNRKLHVKRVNPYTDRVPVGDFRVEDIVREQGFSCNPTQQVSQEQFDQILAYSLGQLLMIANR